MAEAGNLDQRITFLRLSEASDGSGGIVRTWANVPITPTVWANVKAKAGRESLTDGRMNATFVVVFTIYNRSDIDEVDRILWDGAPYDIRNVRREGSRSLYLMIEAERGVA